MESLDEIYFNARQIADPVERKRYVVEACGSDDALRQQVEQMLHDAEGAEDFRMKAFRAALKELSGETPQRAKAVLTSLSDPTTEPIPSATTKAACGAWPGA